MSEVKLTPEQLRVIIDDYVSSAKELRKIYEELINATKSMYEDLKQKQGYLFRLQDEVKSYGLIEGNLSLKYLKQCLKEMDNIDKTPDYAAYYQNEDITDNMKNAKSELPDACSSWITPRELAINILNLIDGKNKGCHQEYDYTQLYYGEERN